MFTTLIGTEVWLPLVRLMVFAYRFRNFKLTSNCFSSQKLCQRPSNTISETMYRLYVGKIPRLLSHRPGALRAWSSLNLNVYAQSLMVKLCVGSRDPSITRAFWGIRVRSSEVSGRMLNSLSCSRGGQSCSTKRRKKWRHRG
jgi:hypothetical protein